MKAEDQKECGRFCFQYCIGLGQGRFGSILINEKSNLYQEAETFC